MKLDPGPNADLFERRSQVKVEVVQVHSLHDIRRVVSGLLAPVTAPPVQTTMNALDPQGNTVQVKLSAPTDCDYVALLKKGFDTLKARHEARAANPRLVMVDGHMWLDDLIQRRLGGKRDGLRIRWDVPEGTFYFDPFSQKLTKAS
jgi:hypothetical protein